MEDEDYVRIRPSFSSTKKHDDRRQPRSHPNRNRDDHSRNQEKHVESRESYKDRPHLRAKYRRVPEDSDTEEELFEDRKRKPGKPDPKNKKENVKNAPNAPKNSKDKESEKEEPEEEGGFFAKNRTMILIIVFVIILVIVVIWIFVKDPSKNPFKSDDGLQATPDPNNPNSMSPQEMQARQLAAARGLPAPPPGQQFPPGHPPKFPPSGWESRSFMRAAGLPPR